MRFSGSAPGSLMMFGEHAVLHGKLALCCAVDQRIRVELAPRSDSQIHLHSPLGQRVFNIKDFTIQPPFEFVLTALDHYRNHFQQGFDLTVKAEFSSTMGLGSSSAVTVATLGALSQWLGLPYSSQELFQEAKTVVLQVQGVGSGADVAAAVFGGIVAYRADPLQIKPLNIRPELSLVYSGAKMPTKQVIAIVAKQQRLKPVWYQRIYEEMEQCTQQAVLALEKQEWQTLGQLMNQHHGLQANLGVSTPLLEELVSQLRQQPQIHGAKISGSGLGDCIIGLGTISEDLFPISMEQQTIGVKQIPVKISQQGYSNL